MSKVSKAQAYNNEHDFIEDQENESISKEDMFKTVHDYSNENNIEQILTVHLKG